MGTGTPLGKNIKTQAFASTLYVMAPVYSDDSNGYAKTGPVPRSLNRQYQQHASSHDGGAPSVIYKFVPSWSLQLSSTGALSSGEQDANGTGGSENIGEPRSPGSISKHPVTNVHESRYTGDGLIGGTHSAGLSTSTDPKPRNQPMFRWIHLYRTSMDFAEFSVWYRHPTPRTFLQNLVWSNGTQNVASQAANLTKVERKGIIDILTRVRRKFIKPIGTPSGRHAQYVEASCIQHILPSADGRAADRPDESHAITWMCLPYFSLEKYSGLDASDKPAFPAPTLLQACFSNATQSRDMQQAVSQIAPPAWCFHIPQLWCLVLGNSLLVTCGRMAQTHLCGDFISLSTVPSSLSPEPSVPNTRLLVSYGGSVMWRLSVDECSTWLDFVMHFLEFWPQPITFYLQKRAVKSTEWPRLCYMAKTVTVTLDLQLGPEAGEEVSPEIRGPPRNILRLQTAPLDGQASMTNTAIFSCLDGVPLADGTAIDAEALDRHMEEVDGFLLNGISLADRSVYISCPKSSRDEVHKMMKTRSDEVSASKPTDEITRDWLKLQRVFEDQVTLFNLADIVFRFFFPTNFAFITVPQYWGAIKLILKVSEYTTETPA
ncbi:CorA-like Mg2+ transporter protein [Geosmithia morbida]|uniref:CorA-like Mg2+ transporter protein n=1 Tax=Geosmithia morbida TaxID=1094350 RepID=A0A9P4YYK5_9HYPO|nr:CorA-like Mg2+ transporter protein [Geosmithia morbida]KAF4125468.1 CorA-like Mg2+ transporter protein [Geosmithia morbida]